MSNGRPTVPASVPKALCLVAVVLVAGLTAACGGIGGALEGIRSIGGAADPGSSGASAAPRVASASHGPWSSLPTSVAFASEAAPEAARLEAWAEKELGVTLEPAEVAIGPDGRELQRFRQTHAGRPVRGALYTAHLEEGRVAETTGLLFDGISVDPTPSVSLDDALRRVIDHRPGLVPLEGPTLEILPVAGPEGTRFHLVHVLPVLDRETGSPWAVHVDAHTGEVVEAEPLSSHLVTPPAAQEAPAGSGRTTEGRTVSFRTEHTSEIPTPAEGIVIEDVRNGFRLKDVGRNLHTMSLNGATDVSIDVFYGDDEGRVRLLSWEYLLPSHDLIEEDNVWESDPDAVDVHWGLTRAYDYFLARHGRRGWDGQNGYTPAVVRYWHHFAMASYHAGGRFLLFGDGGSYGRPFTTPDIVAHEYTHMLSRATVQWRGHGEAGSLDEAVADIFAIHATTDGSAADWRIASGVVPAGFRDLSNPKSLSMPDTYEGDHWGEYQSEFGRELGLQELTRHQNATVMGYWFYLLSEGKEGENDHGEEYEIEPIGMDRAADVVYRALFRINPWVTFEEMREATVEVARRRYGRCSEELRQVTNAWNAVGVGDPFCDCFEGSFIQAVDTDEGPRRIRHYIRGDYYAVEVTAEDGSTHIMNATPGDPYRHVQGQPDFPATDPASLFLRNLFQGRIPLLAPPRRPMTRRQYLRYRDEHRTGRSRALGAYTTYEYRMEGATVWSTEDVCLDLMDYGGVLTLRPSGPSDAMRQVFFGFPVRLERPGEPSTWVEDLREHEVDDRVFRR